jgi:hypothetical protein
MNSWLLFLKGSQIILIILYSIIYVISSQKLSNDQIIRSLLINMSLSSYGEYCNDNNSLSYHRKCNSKYYCHKNQCKCPAGHGFYKMELFSDYRCLKFDNFICSEDSECQDVDNNRQCDRQTNYCKCNKDFYEDKDSKLCKPKLNQTCFSDNDCGIDYSYCKNSLCQCWPEFETPDNQNCYRKICSNNLNCQTNDNPNLICNNTICECEYGYSLDNRRICVKITRRQNCNITCQIIGGLFASIFMLSLVYWCFYCCYSIVKNYKFHNNSRDCADNNENSPENQRFTQTSSNPSIVIRREHNLGQRDGYRYSYYYESDSPPSYSQLDPPPDYETVLNMKLNG